MERVEARVKRFDNMAIVLYLQLYEGKKKRR